MHRKQLSGTRYIQEKPSLRRSYFLHRHWSRSDTFDGTMFESHICRIYQLMTRGVFDAQMAVSKRWGYTAQNWKFSDSSTSGTSDNSYPTCSTTVVKSLPSFTTVFNISGIGCSSKTPSSSPSTGKLTLIALHFAVVISAVRLALER